MFLNYALFKNTLLGAADKYLAVVQYDKSIDIAQLIDKMIEEGSGLTRPQALAYTERLFQIIENYIAEGYRVNLPIACIYATIRGLFDSLDDKFDASKHSVHVQIDPNKRLRDIEKQIKVRKVNPEISQPLPKNLLDLESNRTNDILTPGGMAVLRGIKMKFSLNDPEQGLFLIPHLSNMDTVRVKAFVTIKPSEVAFMVPNGLTKGKYYMEIRTVMRHHKQLRTGRLDKVIEVV